MSGIILDVYFGSKLAQDLSKDTSFTNIFNLHNALYFIFFILIVFVLSVLFFYIIPKINRTPKKYYKRYLAVRKELEKIDELYAKRKLSFEDYVYTQFHYAKEYEHIINYLSKYPEYKILLKNYKLTVLRVNESSSGKDTSEQERKKAELINYFSNLLRPVVCYYKKSEVYQALLDENYAKDIAEGVVVTLDNSGVEFNSKELDKHKHIDELDFLLESKRRKQDKQITTPKEQPKQTTEMSKETKGLQKESTIIDLAELTKQKPAKNYFDELTTFSKYPDKSPSKKEGLFSSIFSKGTPKGKKYSVSEINDVFSKIEKILKEP